MAVNFGDPNSGFRHSEVVVFINEEILSVGGGLDFYVAYRSQSWHQVEDQLRAVVADPQVPRAIKRACTWSALALSVRLAARQRQQQLRRVRRLQEQVIVRETATWALASELQRLREEREVLAAQLRQAQDDLQQSIDEREVLRGQLLQAERSAYSDPESPEAGGKSPAQPQWADPWPHDTEEQVVMETEGVAAIADVPPQMCPGRIYTPGLWATKGSPGKMASLWDQRHHNREEGAGRPTFINFSEHSWSPGDPRNQQSQEKKTKSFKRTMYYTEETQASEM